MNGVPRAFETLSQALELTSAEQERASRQQNVLRDNLRQHVGGVVRDFLVGSYARHTAIRPLHDIDLVVELDPTTHGALRAQGATRCLQAIQAGLQRAYPNKPPLPLQNRSVHIEFEGTGIGFDVVPGFADGTRPGVYWIPDRERNAWIPTAPEGHAAFSTRANERAGTKLKPLVKMLKLWRREQRCELRSFHLEMMSARALTAPPANYAAGLRDLFRALADAVLQACPDPAGVGPAIDEGMSNVDRARHRSQLVQAAIEATRLTQLEAAGRAPEALAGWRALLGPTFPGAGA